MSLVFHFGFFVQFVQDEGFVIIIRYLLHRKENFPWKAKLRNFIG